MFCLLCNIAYGLIIFIGSIKLAQFFFALFKGIHRNLLRKPLDLAERYGKGTWALVTGASMGIGEQCCHELAKQGFNIILVSRSKGKLDTVA